MSKTPWIYCSSIPDDGAVELTPEELRHLVGSHRRRAGESLILFDGSGTVAHAKLGEIKRRSLSGWVKIISQEHHPKPNRKTRLACALPKGDRQGWMLELVTQLGITDFIPLLCAHSVARPGRASYERWERILIETCKQCRRPWLPNLHSEITPSTLLRGATPSTNEAVLLADKDGKAVDRLDLDYRMSNRLILIGPEGGFSIEERQHFLECGAVAISLSEANLRIEAAAAALVSLVASHVHDRKDRL